MGFFRKMTAGKARKEHLFGIATSRDGHCSLWCSGVPETIPGLEAHEAGVLLDRIRSMTAGRAREEAQEAFRALVRWRVEGGPEPVLVQGGVS